MDKRGRFFIHSCLGRQPRKNQIIKRIYIVTDHGSRNPHRILRGIRIAGHFSGNISPRLCNGVIPFLAVCIRSAQIDPSFGCEFKDFFIKTVPIVILDGLLQFTQQIQDICFIHGIVIKIGRRAGFSGFELKFESVIVRFHPSGDVNLDAKRTESFLKDFPGRELNRVLDRTVGISTLRIGNVLIINNKFVFFPNHLTVRGRTGAGGLPGLCCGRIRIISSYFHNFKAKNLINFFHNAFQRIQIIHDDPATQQIKNIGNSRIGIPRPAEFGNFITCTFQTLRSKRELPFIILKPGFTRDNLKQCAENILKRFRFLNDRFDIHRFTPFCICQPLLSLDLLRTPIPKLLFAVRTWRRK